MIEPKAKPIIGAAPVDPSADVVQVPPPPVIEHKTAPITWLFNALAVVMVIPVLVLFEFLFRRTYAKRVLAFGAMSRSQRAPDYARNLSSRPLNQVEADPSVENLVFLQWPHGSSERGGEASPSKGDAGHTNDRGARGARLDTLANAVEQGTDVGFGSKADIAK